MQSSTAWMWPALGCSSGLGALYSIFHWLLDPERLHRSCGFSLLMVQRLVSMGGKMFWERLSTFSHFCPQKSSAVPPLVSAQGLHSSGAGNLVPCWKQQTGSARRTFPSPKLPWATPAHTLWRIHHSFAVTPSLLQQAGQSRDTAGKSEGTAGTKPQNSHTQSLGWNRPLR